MEHADYLAEKYSFLKDYVDVVSGLGSDSGLDRALEDIKAVEHDIRVALCKDPGELQSFFEYSAKHVGSDDIYGGYLDRETSLHEPKGPKFIFERYSGGERSGLYILGIYLRNFRDRSGLKQDKDLTFLYDAFTGVGFECSYSEDVFLAGESYGIFDERCAVDLRDLFEEVAVSSLMGRISGGDRSLHDIIKFEVYDKLGFYVPDSHFKYHAKELPPELGISDEDLEPVFWDGSEGLRGILSRRRVSASIDLNRAFHYYVVKSREEGE